MRIIRVGSKLAFQRAPRVGQLLFFVAVAVCTLGLRPRRLITVQLGSASAAVAMANLALRRPHLVRLTGGGTAKFRSEPFARAASPLGRRVVRLFTRERTCVVAPAKHLLADFREALPKSGIATELVPNGVQDQGPSQNPDVPWASRRGVVWYARSGSETSSELFYRIAEAAADIDFKVMGRAYSEPALANVDFVGWLTRPEALLEQSKILLNTSPNEGMPNTALQALVAGCRVVGPRNQGLVELSETGAEAVAFVDVTRPAEVATALREIMAMGPPNRVGLPSYSDVAQTWKQIFDRLEGISDE